MKKFVYFALCLLFAFASVIMWVLTPAVVDGLHVGTNLCYVLVGLLFIVSVCFSGMYTSENKSE